MFLPISPNPPRGTTCKVLWSNSISSLRSERRLIQVPAQVELLRSDGGEVHLVCSQMLLREARDVLRGHGLDAGGDLLRRQELRAGYYAAADAVHPRRGAFEGKERRALELLLGALQLLFLDLFLHDPLELFDDHLDRLFHVARSGADVGLYRAGVRVALMVGVHSVREPALLTYLLEEATAHASAEDIVQSGHRITVLALGGNAQ